MKWPSSYAKLPYKFPPTQGPLESTSASNQMGRLRDCGTVGSGASPNYARAFPHLHSYATNFGILLWILHCRLTFLRTAITIRDRSFIFHCFSTCQIVNIILSPNQMVYKCLQVYVLFSFRVAACNPSQTYLPIGITNKHRIQTTAFGAVAGYKPTLSGTAL